MNRLRTFLLCLLMAALPLQGMAAVVQASCGPTHQHAASAGLHAEHHQRGALQLDPAQLDHHDRHQHGSDAQHSHHASSLSSADASASTDPGSTHATCSACAACCTGAVAPPSAMLSNPSIDAADTGPRFAAPPMAAFIPAGLERPPRS